MRSIILYGELAKRFGREHHFSVKTAAEAIRALKANFKGFENYMCTAHTQNVGFKVFVGTSKVNRYEDIHNPSSKDTIRIVPVVVGAGSGFFKVFLGIALIATAVFVPGLGLTLPTILGSMGLALVIGGVSQLLTKPPELPTEQGNIDRKESFIFNGATNVSAQGAPVPVGYGRMIVGSAVISAGIETHEEG